MQSDSEILPIEKLVGETYYGPILIKEGTINTLYRVARAGKYFIIKTAKDGNSRFEALIRREYELSITLSHPHIINVFTFEEDSPVGPGIVMEYVDGRTLEDFLAENPSLDLRRRVLDQILEAVAYMHRKGIIHNDLKPANILITRVDNTVKIIDFGLSDDDAHYLTKTLGCTAEYASPELLRQEKTDSRSDIFSLGKIMKDIFGKRLGRISTKASRMNASDRYTDVESLQKAIKRRHYPLLTASAAIILTLLALVGISLGKKVVDLKEFKDRENAKAMFCDSVYNDTKKKVDAAFAELDSKLENIPFQEFGYLELSKTYNELGKIWKTFPKLTDDQALVSGFTLHYQTLVNEHYDRVVNHICRMESMMNHEMSPDERIFYVNLIGNDESYRPYSTIKD